VLLGGEEASTETSNFKAPTILTLIMNIKSAFAHWLSLRSQEQTRIERRALRDYSRQELGRIRKNQRAKSPDIGLSVGCARMGDLMKTKSHLIPRFCLTAIAFLELAFFPSRASSVEPAGQTSLPDADPRFERFGCGACERKFLAEAETREVVAGPDERHGYDNPKQCSRRRRLFPPSG
jgi:hypothetical protein